MTRHEKNRNRNVAERERECESHNCYWKHAPHSGITPGIKWHFRQGRHCFAFWKFREIEMLFSLLDYIRMVFRPLLTLIARRANENKIFDLLMLNEWILLTDRLQQCENTKPNIAGELKCFEMERIMLNWMNQTCGNVMHFNVNWIDFPFADLPPNPIDKNKKMNSGEIPSRIMERPVAKKKFNPRMDSLHNFFAHWNEI